MDNYRLRPSPAGSPDGFGPPTLDTEVLNLRLARATSATIRESAQRRGQRLIVGGFAITLVGVAMYCVGCLGGTPGLELGAALLSGEARIVLPFMAIGGGSLIWGAGAMVFFAGALEAAEPRMPAASSLAESRDPR